MVFFPLLPLTVPGVQVSRFRFFMEELCSRRCSDGLLHPLRMIKPSIVSVSLPDGSSSTRCRNTFGSGIDREMVGGRHDGDRTGVFRVTQPQEAVRVFLGKFGVGHSVCSLWVFTRLVLGGRRIINHARPFRDGCWRSLPPCSAAAANSQKKSPAARPTARPGFARPLGSASRTRAERTKSTYVPAPVPSAVGDPTQYLPQPALRYREVVQTALQAYHTPEYSL